MNKKTLVNPKLEKLANIQFKTHNITKSEAYQVGLNFIAPTCWIVSSFVFVCNASSLNSEFSPYLQAGLVFIATADTLALSFFATIEKSEICISPLAQFALSGVVVGVEFVEGAVEYVVKLPVKLTAKAMVQHQMNKERKIKSLPNGQEIFENLVDAKENKQIAKQKKYEKKISLKEQKQSQKIINQTNKINQKTEEKMQKYM